MRLIERMSRFCLSAVESVGLAQLGLVKKIEQDKDTTTITAGNDVDMEAISERCEQLRNSIDATKSDYEKEKMQELSRRWQEHKAGLEGLRQRTQISLEWLAGQ